MARSCFMELTAKESLYLFDQLSLLYLQEHEKVFKEAVPDEECDQEALQPAELIRKMGSVLLEHHPNDVKSEPPPDTTVSVALSQAEILAIREFVKTSTIVGQERVGLSLALKCSRALQELSASAVVSRYEETEYGEPGKVELADRFGKLRDEGR